MNQEEKLFRELSAQPALFFVQDFLQEHHDAEIFLVGGAVRDILLGRRMREFDFDFVLTGLSSEQIESWFRDRGELSLVGQHFGVYKFMPTGFSSDDIAFIDIALPRTEKVSDGSLGGYKDFDIQSDPHLPIESDLARRDFTVNAMAFDLRTHRLIDPFNGQGDLREKRLRAVGNPTERFTEDLSRILRGLRFAAELDFEIDHPTSEAIKAQIELINTQREIDGKDEYVVPRETVGIELAKALSRNPTRALSQFQSHNVINVLFPSVQTCIQNNPNYLSPLSHALPGELTLVVALLLRGVPTQELSQILSFTGLGGLPRETPQRAEPARILWLHEMQKREWTPNAIKTMPASTFEKIFMNGKGIQLMRCLYLTDRKEVAQAAEDRRKQIEDRWLVDQDESIAPLISGQDVLAQDIPPGPEVRTWLERVRDLQLDGKLMRREDALTWLEEQHKQKSPN